MFYPGQKVVCVDAARRTVARHFGHHVSVRETEDA